MLRHPLWAIYIFFFHKGLQSLLSDKQKWTVANLCLRNI